MSISFSQHIHLIVELPEFLQTMFLVV